MIWRYRYPLTAAVVALALWALGLLSDAWSPFLYVGCLALAWRLVDE
jgi:hypothetical protein